MQIMIIPAILEQEPNEALNKITLFAGVAPKIQLDIADGELVRGKTFLDLSFLESLNTFSNKTDVKDVPTPHTTNINHTSRQPQPPQIQLHLMVQNPEIFILFIPSFIKEVCVQIEAFMYRHLSLEAFDDVLKAKNIKIGLSFNHATPFEDFDYFINQCDFIQFMTVDPGAQGRAFIMESLDKISRFKEKYPHKVLQVDGGIAQDTLPMVLEAGANHLVMGSAIFKSNDPVKSYHNFVLQYENAKQNSVNSSNTNSAK